MARTPAWRRRVGAIAVLILAIRWHAEFELWRVDPAGGAPSFYEFDQ